ncbi:MAG: hypothetical protein ACJ79V_24105 [Myxococcales bacterium]
MERERLERAGFAAHRTAHALREVLERYTARDRLATRLCALEQAARGIGGEVLVHLREAEGALP